MRKIAAITMLTLLCTAALAQQKGTFTDTRDKKAYKTAKIGERTWMAENLNYDAKGSKCYDNKPANCAKYGRLYKWAAAMNFPDKCNAISDLADADCKINSPHSGICPKGWHLPGDYEWQALVNFAGGYNNAAGQKLKAKSGWNDYEGKSGNGTDDYGFSALPNGGGNSDGDFYNVGESGSWWSTNEYDASSVYHHLMYYGSAYVSRGDETGTKSGLKSVRCVQDKTEAEEKVAVEAEEKVVAEMNAKAKAEAEAAKAKAEAERAKAQADKAKAEAKEKEKKASIKKGTFTDPRNKKAYKTVTLGTQTWMAENLNYDAKDSKCYDNKPENCQKYGRLYDWNMAKEACPKGWHLPSDAEWTKLTDFVGGDNVAKELKAASGWNDQGGKSGNDTDDYGFSALPGGYYDGILKNFDGVGGFGFWWSSTKSDASHAYKRSMAPIGGVSRDEDNINSKLRNLYSVRCIQGEATEEAKAKEAAPPQPTQQPASQPASQPKQQSANEFCTITFPKKSCISMPKGTCKMTGGKVVDKCP